VAGDIRHCEDVVDASDEKKQCAMIFKSRYEYIHKQLHLSIIEIPNTKVKSVWDSGKTHETFVAFPHLELLLTCPPHTCCTQQLPVCVELSKHYILKGVFTKAVC